MDTGNIRNIFSCRHSSRLGSALYSLTSMGANEGKFSGWGGGTHSESCMWASSWVELVRWRPRAPWGTCREWRACSVTIQAYPAPAPDRYSRYSRYVDIWHLSCSDHAPPGISCQHLSCCKISLLNQHQTLQTSHLAYKK